MLGDEARVVDAFCAYLEADGWQVTREAEFVDVVAHKAGTTIYAEATGRTTSPGLDVDTMYGQLLRRMGDESRAHARYAVVVPDTALSAAKRVPTSVRSRLGIDVYAVYENGRVEVHGSTALTDPDNFQPVLVEETRTNAEDAGVQQARGEGWQSDHIGIQCRAWLRLPRYGSTNP
jgi:hypothetical protein